jgi:hypothetical protein
MNSYIKEMSGSQVTPSELGRFKQSIPNPGSGLFDGDSPTQFESKLSDFIASAQLAAARAALAMKGGFLITKYELDEVGDMMRKRALELYGEMDPNLPDKERRIRVKEQVHEEFGIGT